MFICGFSLLPNHRHLRAAQRQRAPCARAVLCEQFFWRRPEVIARQVEVPHVQVEPKLRVVDRVPAMQGRRGDEHFDDIPARQQAGDLLDAAVRDQVVAAPTLVKLAPLPLRRIIGDLSDEPRVLRALNLPPNTDAR